MNINNIATYKLILAHGPQQRGNDQGWRTLGLVAAAVLALALLLVVSKGSWRVAGGVIGNLILILACIAWGGLVYNLLLQNQPNSARLVPGHLARLREVMVAGWLFTSVLGAASLMLVGLSLMPAWLIAAWSVATLAVMIRWPLGWAVIWVLPLLAIWFYKKGWLAGPVELLQTRPYLCMLLTLLVLPLPLVQLLRDGGGAHRNAYSRAQYWREVAREGVGAQTWDNSRLPAPLAWFSRLNRAPYHRQLERLSASSDPSTISSRLMLGLGPAAHWTAQLSGLLMFGTIFILVCLAGLWIPIPFTDFLRAGSFGLTIGLMSALLSPLTGMGRTLVKTRHEQRLLVLLPGVPRGRELNRQLAWHWLVQFGMTWLLGLVVAVGVMAYSGASVELLLPFLLAYLLPVVVCWRDWAREPSNGRASLRLIFCVVASALLGYVLYRLAGVPIWLYGSLQLALALGLGAVRWRQQLAAPQALPVGRLA
ncbi:hypothetical protein [Pelomonas sp. SE-A7]|uniref:hypothetical protein n=1 Tax=Pelomonas sp. SE-A7 TaxID=3054953 RepID=UPI00259CFF62|nr:hypothetical protein [Pelomonas sp. SE-A7]MDM4767112.1 hypothetical protein [Pelomonas sp. SE-A7]